MTGYGIVVLLILFGMLFKDRTTKYRYRMACYIYMGGFESTQAYLEEEIWLKFFYLAIVLLWIGLAYKDTKSKQFFDREFAKLDRMKKESEANIAKLFYDRRN